MYSLLSFTLLNAKVLLSMEVNSPPSVFFLFVKLMKNKALYVGGTKITNK